jgi:hypothetical protein
MNLQQRKELLVRLGNYMLSDNEDWQAAKKKATAENPWFIMEFIDKAVGQIAQTWLKEESISQLTGRYPVAGIIAHPKKIGIVMAGNIPLVGFHDLMCVFLSGHYAVIKPSVKDEALITHLVKKMVEWSAEAAPYVTISSMIPNCDAYIATGSNNSSRYFEYYFRKYPSIIRKNRTSVAILTGRETDEELERLADDVHLYFGLGCRNVTKIFVPRNYDFLPLLSSMGKYNYLINHHKYKNNYDYNLAIHILNNQYYMSNDSLLLVENNAPFSRISQLHYEFYTDEQAVREQIKGNENIQCIVSYADTDFGTAQRPGICDYADGTDTMQFLSALG